MENPATDDCEELEAPDSTEYGAAQIGQIAVGSLEQAPSTMELWSGLAQRDRRCVASQRIDDDPPLPTSTGTTRCSVVENKTTLW